MGPTVLLVGTAGVEVDGLVPGRLAGHENIHTSQPWRPRACQCGLVHPPCDQHDLAIFVGTAQHGVHANPESAGVAIVPDDLTTPTPHLPAVIATPTDSDGFGPFATRVIDHLVSPFLVPGLICVDFADVVRILSSGQRFRYIQEAGDQSLEGLARDLAARRWWNQAAPQPSDLLIGFTGSPDVTLADISRACNLLMGVLADDPNVIFYATIDGSFPPGPESRIGLLGAT